MQIGRLREPREVEVALVAATVLELLSQDMDDVFLELLERAGEDLNGPCRRRASVANRVVRLCRRLLDEMRRYERMRMMESDPDAENQDVEF